MYVCMYTSLTTIVTETMRTTIAQTNKKKKRKREKGKKQKQKQKTKTNKQTTKK